MSDTTTRIRNTHGASSKLRNASEVHIGHMLLALADTLERRTGELLAANARDVGQMESGSPRLDRLMLNEDRIGHIARAIRKVASLPDPGGRILEKRTLANGLELEKISVPLGVVGAVYESRPNVTFDIAALCLRSRNACVLKGSTEANETNQAAVRLIREVLKENDLPENAVTLLSPERETVSQLFTATKYVDVLIPRGSDNLIRFVRANSLVPVIETGAGVCHIYVEKDANLDKAVDIVVNAKVSRPSVCNAMDAILIDRPVAQAFLEKLSPLFNRYLVTLYADAESYGLLGDYPDLKAATPADFGREFLSLQCAIRVVKGIDEALEHIATYSTKHSEAIISENSAQCEQFLREVDAAAVYSNASTRFTDGEEFGLGAEIGISTQKLHARGPFALEKLVTEKWILRGHGQVR